MVFPTQGHLFRALPIALALSACGGESAPPVTAEESLEVTETYARILHAAYSDAVTGAQALDGAIDAMLASPSESTLTAARTAWTASRPAYLETEVARFYDGPIDDPETGPEGLVNAWPLDEAYIDYVVDASGTPVEGGLIYDDAELPTIDEASIAERNQVGSEENVSTGYHAVEFLLWGQDRSTTGPGARAHTDYVEGGEATGVARRRAYLAATSSLLVTHLEEVRDAWSESAGNYRADMIAAADEDPREPLRRILVGMGSLSGAELAGERMNVAYMTKEQEDEHSCFSDTTLQDQLHDAIGIRNVYLGRYTRTDGSVVEGESLSDLVASRDADLDARMREQLDASVTAIEAIPGPFDQAILGTDDAAGRVAIAAAVDALRAQTRTIAEIAALLGVTINLEE
ncbi:imelysin family protein [Sandaracinus amylolyticus]|uniref:imelysin family protein n=1 Tax=Sandaracinus amylolyticus TaxID=927083 RepID=UPI001F443ABE|nr:imelysin family protein [Sandaracinus amylolyticus]UJR79365.1 Iron-regulated protein A [Sandaracinus amylolyticus]